MRITFVIGSLDSGGAQRVLILLTEGLVNRDHFVSVVTLNGKEKDFFHLSERVSRIALDISTRREMFLCIPKLRRGILSTTPDVVVSFIDTMNIMTLLAMRGREIPTVVSDRIDPRASGFGPLRTILKDWTYRRANRIIVQTEGAASYFLPTFKETTQVIPNPVVPLPHSNMPLETVLKKPMVLSVGRLRRQKGFDILIQAFARIKEMHPNWTLTILGEGPLRRNLELMGRKLNLGQRLQLPGRVKHSLELFKQADLFVLSSRYEGFPNVLCEAMACGMAVISTDCPSGPREIIRDGLDGLIVKNEDSIALSNAMDRLMSDETERRHFASRSTEIVGRYSLNKIIQIWDTTLEQVLSENNIDSDLAITSTSLRV